MLGDAVIKKEGYCSSFEKVATFPWHGAGKEANEAFNTFCSGRRWIKGAIKTIVKKIYLSGWDDALMWNAEQLSRGKKK